MTDLEVKLLAVQKEVAAGYGNRPLPCQLDLRITEFVDSFIQSTASTQGVVVSKGGASLARLLLVFAERMASLAVRHSSKTDLLRGLVALVAEGWSEDHREDLATLSLLHDAAIRIGWSPSDAFERVHAYASQPVWSALTRFLRRSDEDKAIEAMGYRAAGDGDGFLYSRDW